jgi:hypothetical protein
MDPATTAAPGLALSTPATGGITIAGLSGNLDIACAPALREQLLGLLRPGTSRLASAGSAPPTSLQRLAGKLLALPNTSASLNLMA